MCQPEIFRLALLSQTEPSAKELTRDAKMASNTRDVNVLSTNCAR